VRACGRSAFDKRLLAQLCSESKSHIATGVIGSFEAGVGTCRHSRAVVLEHLLDGGGGGVVRNSALISTVSSPRAHVGDFRQLLC
jgi:hypothetical protein